MHIITAVLRLMTTMPRTKKDAPAARAAPRRRHHMWPDVNDTYVGMSAACPTVASRHAGEAGSGGPSLIHTSHQRDSERITEWISFFLALGTNRPLGTDLPKLSLDKKTASRPSTWHTLTKSGGPVGRHRNLASRRSGKHASTLQRLIKLLAVAMHRRLI